MAAFSSLSSALGGGLNPFQAVWAPLLGAAVSQTRADPVASDPADILAVSGTASDLSLGPSASSETTSAVEEVTVDETGGDETGAGETEAGDKTASAAEEVRRSGRPSLIATSLRGVLTPRPGGLVRKTLLGE